MTDMTNFDRLCDISIWKAKDGKSWQVWIEHSVYPCATFGKVLERIRVFAPRSIAEIKVGK